MFMLAMNYRDEKILEWLRQHKTIKLKYRDIASKYNCSERTAKRICKTFKDAGFIEIQNYKRGGITIHTKE